MVYMLTQRGYIDGIHVTIYSSTMDPMGNIYIDSWMMLDGINKIISNAGF